MRALPLLLLCVSTLTALPVGAQFVAGDFVGVDSAAVPAARVTLHAPDGRVVSSALTDERGRYQLRAPAPGTYVVRGERIGYQLTESAPIALGEGETVTQRLVSTATRVLLDALAVEAGSRCAGHGTTAETATVWEEVRKALGAVQANERRQARFTVERFHREIEPTSGALRREERSTHTGTSEKPFTPADLARLSANGYIEPAGDTLVYHAPDADVLLSDAFLAEHCFRLQTAPAGLIGLAFEPVRGRRVPDVEGVLWVDRASAELRGLEWTYTRAPIPGPRGVPGGRMDFVRLSDGRWITSAWVLRMPEEGRAQAAAYGTGQRRQIVTIREMGGSVRGVSGP
jgi:hypothetical protein